MHDPQFENQANLIITKLSRKSPAEIGFKVNADASPQGIAEALKIGIDAITQAPLRRKETELNIQARTLELKIKEQEAQSAIADQEQSRSIVAQNTNLEQQQKLIELEAKRLELQERRLDMEKKRIDYALDTASKMIQILSPESDQGMREMLIQTLLPDLLQLGNGKGLELLFPVSQYTEETTS